jgi:hypothetical protein
MAFTYGFYNSLNHDRVYDALQLSMIFDGIISDGIYATVDECMIVKSSEEENTVIVQSGRGWFNHTWNYNDADLPMVGDDSELVLDRIDALVIDINRNELYRENSIQWVKGTASSNPTNPTLTNTTDHFQYPLAYVYRKANNNTINQADITNAVGTSECPFVTGVIDTVNIDELLLQWRDQWTQFVKEYENEATEWTDDKQKDYDAWFANLKYVLNGDVAGKLQTEIEEITETEFNRFYSLSNSSTTIDDTTNTIVETTEEATITTIFSDDNTIVTTIVPNSGNFDYVSTTTIADGTNGSTISTTYVKKGK